MIKIQAKIKQELEHSIYQKSKCHTPIDQRGSLPDQSMNMVATFMAFKAGNKAILSMEEILMIQEFRQLAKIGKISRLGGGECCKGKENLGAESLHGLLLFNSNNQLSTEQATT